MDLSNGVNAFAGSPPSSSFLPSSVSRKEAARCGDMPGVILASKELSSGNGGGTVGSTEVRPSILACLSGSLLLSLEFGAGNGVLLRISCSRILGSGGRGRRHRRQVAVVGKSAAHAAKAQCCSPELAFGDSAAARSRPTGRAGKTRA